VDSKLSRMCHDPLTHYPKKPCAVIVTSSHTPKIGLGCLLQGLEMYWSWAVLMGTLGPRETEGRGPP
jgi:hypothetical protein